MVDDGTSMRHCPRCDRDLPLSDFGVMRARADGLNLYCKPCIREKMNLQRAILNSNNVISKARRKPDMLAARNCRWVREGKDAAERILRAIESGARSQKAIKEITWLSVDQVSDGIAELLFPPDNVPKIRTMFHSLPEASWDTENWHYEIAA